MGEKLKDARMERNLKIADVAEKAKLAPSALSDYENDKKNPTVESLKKIAVFYNISLDYLAGLTTDKKGNADIKAVETRLGLDVESQKKLAHLVSTSSGKWTEEERTYCKDMLSLINLLLSSYKHYENDASVLFLIYQYLRFNPEKEYDVYLNGDVKPSTPAPRFGRVLNAATLDKEMLADTFVMRLSRAVADMKETFYSQEKKAGELNAQS